MVSVGVKVTDSVCVPAPGTVAGLAKAKPPPTVALVMGDVHSLPPLVRIHSQCLTGDVFHSMRCDCRQQLELALSMITLAVLLTVTPVRARTPFLPAVELLFPITGLPDVLADVNCIAPTA